MPWRRCAAPRASKSGLEPLDVYSVGLCVIFFVEADPVAFKAEIQTYLDHLLSIQKPHGGWGYRDRTTGDTSMTQYGVLALWESEHAGFKPRPGGLGKGNRMADSHARSQGALGLPRQ